MRATICAVLGGFLGLLLTLALHPAFRRRRADEARKAAKRGEPNRHLRSHPQLGAPEAVPCVACGAPAVCAVAHDTPHGPQLRAWCGGCFVRVGGLGLAALGADGEPTAEKWGRA